jgi:hypothetical protein
MSGEEGDPRNEALESRARELFEASVRELDGRTASRLARARAAAVAELDSRRSPAWQWAAPVAVAASAALVAVLLARAPGESPAPVAAADAAAGIEALELLAAGEDLELAAEDPEFYAWLELAVLDDPDGQG